LSEDLARFRWPPFSRIFFFFLGQIPVLCGGRKVPLAYLALFPPENGFVICWKTEFLFPPRLRRRLLRPGLPIVERLLVSSPHLFRVTTCLSLCGVHPFGMQGNCSCFSPLLERAKPPFFSGQGALPPLLFNWGAAFSFFQQSLWLLTKDYPPEWKDWRPFFPGRASFIH